MTGIEGFVEHVEGGASSVHLKSICDVLDHLRKHTHEPYWIDARDSDALMAPLLADEWPAQKMPEAPSSPDHDPKFDQA